MEYSFICNYKFNTTLASCNTSDYYFKSQIYILTEQDPNIQLYTFLSGDARADRWLVWQWVVCTQAELYGLLIQDD